MTTAEAAEVITDWFTRVRVASLVLPNGWFGRPYDNLHELTWAGATRHKLLVELDSQLLLILTDPGDVDFDSAELRITGCVQVVLDWQEYGNMTPHSDNHGPGTVRLVTGPGHTTRSLGDPGSAHLAESIGRNRRYALISGPCACHPPETKEPPGQRPGGSPAVPGNQR